MTTHKSPEFPISLGISVVGGRPILELVDEATEDEENRIIASFAGELTEDGKRFDLPMGDVMELAVAVLRSYGVPKVELFEQFVSQVVKDFLASFSNRKAA